jgi:hypothetical protein
MLFVLMASVTHADLLLHYSFDGDLTDTTGVYDGDARGTNNNGSYKDPSLEFVEGKFGQAANFSGDDWIWVDGGNPLDQLTTEVTIAFWTKMDAVQNEAQVVTGMDSDGGGRLAFVQFWYGTTYWDTTGNRAQASIPAAAADGEWHHWAYTKNSVTGLQTIYFDGEIIGQSTDAFTPFGDPFVGLALGAHFEWGSTYTGGLDELMIFNEELSQSRIQGLFAQPILVAPALGEIGVPAWATLQWKGPRDPNTAAYADPNVAAFVVYCDPDEAAVKNATYDNHAGLEYFSDQLFVGSPFDDSIQVFDPVPDLAVNTTYYWRVDTRYDDAVEPNELTVGNVWWFDTNMKPLINSEPADVLVFDTESAVFSVVAQDLTGTGLSYQWYKDPNPAVADDEVILPGQTNATLTLNAPLGSSDEGYYVCEITNIGGSVWTRSARLILKRLVNHYPFDGDFADSESGYNGTGYGNPNFVAGIVGSGAIELTGSEGVGMALFDEAYPNAGQEITVSAWVYADTLSSGASIVKNWTDHGEGGLLYFGLNGAGTNLEALANTTGQFVGIGDTASFATGQWQFVAFVFDGAQARLYRNGAQVASAALAGTLDRHLPYVGIGFIPSDVDGSPSLTTPNYWDGKIDDVRIYNYGLSPEEMAQLYYDVTGIATCLNAPAYDLDGDCLVTLSDFAKIAGEWLACGLSPAAGCP